MSALSNIRVSWVPTDHVYIDGVDTIVQQTESMQDDQATFFDQRSNTVEVRWLTPLAISLALHAALLQQINYLEPTGSATLAEHENRLRIQLSTIAAPMADPAAEPVAESTSDNRQTSESAIKVGATDSLTVQTTSPQKQPTEPAPISLKEKQTLPSQQTAPVTVTKPIIEAPGSAPTARDEITDNIAKSMAQSTRWLDKRQGNLASRPEKNTVTVDRKLPDTPAHQPTKPRTPDTPIRPINRSEAQQQETFSATQTIAGVAQKLPEPTVGNAPEQQSTDYFESLRLITHPKYLKPPTAPHYPRSAKRRKQQGEVVVRARISTTGEVNEVRLYKSSGFKLLDSAALRATRGWLFVPASRNGQAITAWVQVPVRFTLND